MSRKSQPVIFRNQSAAKRMAASYRKQFGLGLDGEPRRYNRKGRPSSRRLRPITAAAIPHYYDP